MPRFPRYEGTLPRTRIPERFERDLRRKADKLGLKVSNLVRFALDLYLYGNKDVVGAPDLDGGESEAT